MHKLLELKEKKKEIHFTINLKNKKLVKAMVLFCVFQHLAINPTKI